MVAAGGKARRNARTVLSDALGRAGFPDQALPFYEQALEEAEAAEDWSHVAAIAQNAAGAYQAGNLDEALAMYGRAAEAGRKARAPRIEVLGTELEVWRVRVMQGRADEVAKDIAQGLETGSAVSTRPSIWRTARWRFLIGYHFP